VFCLNGPSSAELSTLSLHDALPISSDWPVESTRNSAAAKALASRDGVSSPPSASTSSRSPPTSVATIGRPHAIASRTTFGELSRSEEHTSELQSRRDLVCRLLLEKK